MRILVVRHAEQERTGQDGPLTATGREQATWTAAAVALRPEDRLVASTQRRAVDTAAALGRTPEKVPDLDEFRFGPAWTWELAEDREDLALWRPDDRPPGGESLREFQARVDGALRPLLAEPPAGRLVLVVHSGVIDAVLRWAFGLGPETPWSTEAIVPHASVTELHHWPGGRHARGAERHTLLIRLGDAAHLPEHLRTGL